MRTSETIKEIAPAFHKFQKDCETPKKTAENKHIGNKYAPLDAILEVVTPALTENGLFHVQDTINGENNHIGVKTIVYHVSGEFFEFETLWLPIGSKITAQAIGSAISYARRYALCAALGIMAESDDDGQTASDAAKEGNSSSYNPTGITQAQKDKINKLVEEKRGEIKAGVFVKEHLMPAMNTKSMPDKWSKAQAGFAIKKLEEWGKEDKTDAKA